MGSYRSGHNGAVLKTGGHFGSRPPKNLVFSMASGYYRKEISGDFSPKVLSFFHGTFFKNQSAEKTWRVTEAVITGWS